MNAPCKDCKDRAPGCHSRCEKYIAFTEEVKRRREAERADAELFASNPNRQARVRHYQIQKLRGNHK